jgi:hypothetical protein
VTTIRLSSLAGLSFVMFTSAASAQITAIGQFAGAYNEVVATSHPGFAECVPQRVFAGTADLCTVNRTTGAPIAGLLSASGWSFVCMISPFSPPLFYGSASGVAEYTFDSPITRFGGQFGTNWDLIVNAGGGTAVFYDASLVEIGTMPIPLTACGVWEWQGWESTVPVKRIRIIANFSSGEFLHMDDLTYDLSGGSSCYANCDGSTVEPILNVDDFTCFINEYAAAQSLPHEQQLTHYANCDSSTTAPALNVDDFTCFINQYATGCP